MEDITLVSGFLTNEESKSAFDSLIGSIEWTNKMNVIGTSETKKINRKMAYVADDVVRYEYANFWFNGTTWNDTLLGLRSKLEDFLGVEFNSVLLNLYENGKDEIRWHSDNEKSLGDDPIIACINLGATRKFWFVGKEEGSEKFFKSLSNGDLLVMGEKCQSKYLHAVLKEKEVKEPRISLTFRFNK